MNHVHFFRDEADELLLVLELAMLELEMAPQNFVCVERAFCAMHTIKGSSAVFGYNSLAAFAHHLVEVFGQVRSGNLAMTRDLINIGRDAANHIRTMLIDQMPGPDIERSSEALLARMSMLVPENDDTSMAMPLFMDVTYRIRIKPAIDAMINGMDPLCILRELQSLGPCRTTLVMDEVPDLEVLHPAYMFLIWDVILTSDQPISTIEQVVIFGNGEWDIDIEIIDSGVHCPDMPEQNILLEMFDDKEVAQSRSC